MTAGRDALLYALEEHADLGDFPPCRIYRDAGWVSEANAEQRYAARLCEPCPALARCRAYGIDNPTEVGVYGGLTESERRQARKEAS